MATASVPAQSRTEIGIRGGLNIATQSTENTGWVATTRHALMGENYTDDFATSSRVGFQMGVFLVIDLGARFCIQPELMYTRKGVKVEGIGILSSADSSVSRTLSEDIKLDYLELPLLLKYRIARPSGLTSSLFVGPSLGLCASGRDEFQENSAQYGGFLDREFSMAGRPSISNLKSVDFGLVFGCDIAFPIGSRCIVLDVRYTMGTSEVFEDVDPASIPMGSIYEDFPEEYPIVRNSTGEASDARNRVLSITLGVSFPL